MASRRSMTPPPAGQRTPVAATTNRAHQDVRAPRQPAEPPGAARPPVQPEQRAHPRQAPHPLHIAKGSETAERVAPAAAPRAAIVIDDLGQRTSDLEKLAALDIPLTIAVIPGLPATAATVREASRLGIEMILHQPMEPREEAGKNPGTGVLLTGMSAEEVRGRLRESLAAVPGAVGVNNHMGSRFTEETAGLVPVMEELKARGLFWLDSRTTAATRGAETARAAGVPVLERDVFLDAEVKPEFIRAQLRRAVAIAHEHGQAIGIGHPHPETIAALRELRGELLDSGVTLVRLSALVPPAAGAGTAVASQSRPAKERAGRTAVALP